MSYTNRPDKWRQGGDVEVIFDMCPSVPVRKGAQEGDDSPTRRDVDSSQ